MVNNMLRLSFPVFVILVLSLTACVFCQTQSCITPTRLPGTCKSIYDCQSLRNILQRKPLSENYRRFLRDSECQSGTGRPPYVCCSDTTPTVRPVTKNTRSNGYGKMLPSPPQCGVEPPINKIYNGKETSIDELRWMALLEYERRDRSWVLSCGGTLINQRYVLTAAHCVKGNIEKDVGRLVNVRLGDYNTNTNPDCVYEGNQQDCNDPVRNVGIEEIIPHPEYSETDRNNYHDIALIRLSEDVDYTHFIAPICLPPRNLRSLPGNTLTVAGWGRTITSRRSNIKLKLSVPAVSHQECSEKFATKGVELLDSQLCAGGKYAEDSCDGDSGGPLLRASQNYWYIEGIVSFGNRCGLQEWPAVYTRVNSYLDWITDNMRS